MAFHPLVVGLLMTLAASGCAVRRVPNTFSELATRVPPGATVYVTMADGSDVEGALVTASASLMTVSLGDGSMRDLASADVTEVRARDPLWNGMLTGAAIGGVGAFALADESCLEPYALPDCRKVSRGAGAAMGAAIGAALGAGFDVLHHQRVFRTRNHMIGASVVIAPVLTSDAVAVRVSSRF